MRVGKSQCADEFGEGNAERRRDLAHGAQSRVECPTLELLVVGQGKTMFSHHIELREARLVAEPTAAFSETLG